MIGRYPSMPRLLPSGRVRGMAEADLARLIRRPVAAYEKLDGINVAIQGRGAWLDVLVRKSVTRPHGEQAGLFVYLARRTQALRDLLADRYVGFFEWMQITQTIRYTRLPSFLILLDLFDLGQGAFLSFQRRRALAERCGIATLAPLFVGRVDGVSAVQTLVCRSDYGPSRMEGLVLKGPVGPERVRLKWVRSGFVQRRVPRWRGPHNRRRTR